MADHFFVVAASQRNAFADPSMELICSAAQGIVVSPCPAVRAVRVGDGGDCHIAMEKWGKELKELEVKHQTCDVICFFSDLFFLYVFF